jgi:predicted Ser/Thr protein kinase
VQPLATTDPRHIGDFSLDGVLGRGGQGTVYLGQDSSGGKVAVKVLNVQLAADADARRRFVREAEAARRVARFCTARVVDAGIADGQPYIVSEFIPGPALDSLVRNEGARSGSGLERLAVATLTALAAIHRAGIVHRDFKPSNVIMGTEGPVVIDFGIARTLDQTVTSQVIGTPAFMAPEQFMGGAVGPEVDLFSWAGTMVFAATGQHAFTGDTMPALMRAILDTEPDLTGVPADLRPMLEKCFAKDPGNRPNADEVLRWLTGEQHPHQDSDQPTTSLTAGALPPPGRPRTKLLDAAPGSAAGRPPNVLLAAAAPGTMVVAMLLGFLSMPVALDSDDLVEIAFGLFFLSTPMLGMAVWRHHIGARIALCSTFPLGLVYLYWGFSLDADWGLPEALFVLVPTVLQGVAIALAAAFLWRMGQITAVFGIVAGTSLVVFGAIRLLDALPDVDIDVDLVAVGVIGIIAISIWSILLGTKLVRRSLRGRQLASS